MASDHSDARDTRSDQQHGAQNVTFVLGGGNRSRQVAKIKIVNLNAQQAEHIKAEQLRHKDNVLKMQAEQKKKEICEQLSIKEAPEVTAGGYSVKLNWKQPEIISCQYSEKLKSAEHLHNLLPKHTKITYTIKMTAKDKSTDVVYSGSENFCSVNDLKPGGNYSFCVIPSIGEFTASAPSPEAKYSLPAEIPSTPPMPKIVAKSKSSVTIRWNAPSDNGALIIEYSLEWSMDADYKQVYCGKEKQHKMVYKFTPGSLTKFRVKARNEIGWSQFSESVTYTCAAAAPEAPPTPECVDIRVCHATIRWSSPDDNGAPITSYKLEMDDVDTGYGFRVIYQGEQACYSCSELHRKSIYKFRVCAINSAGAGSFSPVVECTTLPDLPGCPVSLTLKEKATSTTLHIQWDAPKDDGGSAITEYVVEICTQSDETFHEACRGEMCSCEIKGLSPGTSCKIRVCAVSAGGMGLWTDILTLNTRAVCPDPTGRPRIKSKPKQESVMIAWDPPKYNGGAVIKFYNVMRKHKDQWALVAVVQDSIIEKGTSYSYTVNRLCPGTSYQFSIVCQNIAGKSANSETLDVVTAASIPDAPPSPFIICSSPTSANVKWEQPVGNGDKIISYNLKWSEDEDDVNPQTVPVTNSRCYVVKNLSPATTYGCSVQAVNGVGGSNWSTWSSFTTLPSSPGVIQHCKVLSKSCSTMVVYWTSPHSNGSPVTAYHIELNGARVATVTGSLTEATLTDLTPHTDYRIRVQAGNKVGVGPFSSTVLVTTLPLPPAPPILQLQSANQNSLKLSWPRKQDKGCTYMLEMQLTTGKYKVVYEGTSQSHRITRLLPNSTYTFRLCCTNESGRGDWSNATSFTTMEPPPSVPKALTVNKATSSSLTFNWEGVMATGGGQISYELQSRLVNTERDFTQVYKGPLLSYTLSSLPADSCIEARVRAVRQAAQKADQLFSQFTEVKHKTLELVSQPPASEDEISEPETVKSRFLLTEKQIAFMLFALTVILTLLTAVGIGYLTVT